MIALNKGYFVTTVVNLIALFFAVKVMLSGHLPEGSPVNYLLLYGIYCLTRHIHISGNIHSLQAWKNGNTPHRHGRALRDSYCHNGNALYNRIYLSYGHLWPN